MKCSTLFLLSSNFFTTIFAQYFGYNRTQYGDEGSTVYKTANTPSRNFSVPPDVSLNASVSVGEIFIEVENLTAKINLDAQVLQLLDFNAGVDASIDRVTLQILNVSAKVNLEARLGNLVGMIGNVMDSLDLNPLVGTIGQTVGGILDGVPGVGGGGGDEEEGSIEKREFKLDENILYSVNDYGGNTHTNRILAQTGALVDQYLRNDGSVYDEKVVGRYNEDMHFNGYNETVVKNGEIVRMLEYEYKPFPGLIAIAAIYVDVESGTEVLGAKLLAESSGGGSSTISADD